MRTLGLDTWTNAVPLRAGMDGHPVVPRLDVRPDALIPVAERGWGTFSDVGHRPDRDRAMDHQDAGAHA